MRPSTLLVPILGAVLLATAVSAADAQSRRYETGRVDWKGFLSVGGGLANVSEETTPGEIRLEYRHDEKLWIFKPFLGITWYTDGAFYGYGGFGVDLFFGRRIVFTPNAAVGGWSDGTVLRLGHELEFRTGGEIAYRFDDGSRLGLAVHHISNANIGDKNPGTESVVLNYSIPIGRLLGP